MHVKDAAEAPPFVAGDRSEIRELLHPRRGPAPEAYSVAHALVRPGAATLPHTLAHSEVYYVLEGSGLMHVDDEARRVAAGHAVFIPPRAKQWIENTGSGDLTFLCIVSPPWTAECETVCEQAPSDGGRREGSPR